MYTYIIHVMVYSTKIDNVTSCSCSCYSTSCYFFLSLIIDVIKMNIIIIYHFLFFFLPSVLGILQQLSVFMTTLT